MDWVVASAIGKPILEGLLKIGGRRIDAALRGNEAERGVAEAMRAAIPAAVRATMPEGNAEPTEKQLDFVGTVIEEALTRESLGSALLSFDPEALRDQAIEREWRRLLTERLSPLDEPAFDKDPSWAAMEGLDLAVLYDQLVTYFVIELRARRAGKSLQGLVDELDSGEIQRRLKEIQAQLRIQGDERHRQREVVVGFMKFMKNRRVLYNPWEREKPDWVIQSIVEIRNETVKSLGVLGDQEGQAGDLDKIREACVIFLEESYERSKLDAHLSVWRNAVGPLIIGLCNTYGIDDRYRPQISDFRVGGFDDEGVPLPSPPLDDRG